MTRRRAYWTCQLAGWGVYALANGVLSAVSGRLTPGGAAGTLAVSALGLGMSHVVRAVVGRRGWLGLGLPALVPRLAGTSVVGAAAMLAVVLGVLYGLRSADVPDVPSAALVVVLLFNWSVLLVGWSTIYAAVHLLWRWQASEHERARVDADRWRLDAAVKEAELQALQAQVNPHFLFNSLNSVRALIAESPARAQQAVTELAALLRYSLAAGPSPLVPLADELAAVRAYLALEGVRFEERLRWHVDAPGEAAGVAVPPFVVQTLVENAVKHGVGRRPEGGDVRVVVVSEADGARVAVENTGRIDAAPGTAPGVGLANARERLRRLVGPGATLTLVQAGPLTVRAEITLPAVAATGPTVVREASSEPAAAVPA